MSLIIDHVTGGYGHLPVLKDISFNVQPGEIVGLIGLNGAGKSTTITGPFTVMSGDKTATVNVTKPASGSSSSVFYYKTGDMLPEDTKRKIAPPIFRLAGLIPADASLFTKRL